jgi:hypothetical protein
MYTQERIRRDYFDRWMWNPGRVETGTKMPTFFALGKPSQIDNILDGNAAKQIEAMWQYLQQGRTIKHPD